MNPLLIIIKDSVVDSAVSYKTGDDVEKAFLNKCAELISNWDEYSAEDKDFILEDGYEKFGNGSICIVWPSEAE